MVYSFQPMLAPLRAIQRALMTEECAIKRDGSLIATVACRKHKDRLFSEPGDPQDANLRSTQEWGFTFPEGTDVEVSDTVEGPDGSPSIIVGEVLRGDTWEIAVRVWGTEPKTATPHTTVTLWRYDSDDDDWAEAWTGDVQVVYDRNKPIESPVRFVPAGRSVYKGGAIVGPLDMDVRVGDRFTLDGFAANITYVLPEQPQRVEAHFDLDVSGPRIG